MGSTPSISFLARKTFVRPPRGRNLGALSALERLVDEQSRKILPGRIN
jgi:hypothetical protein